MKSKYESKETYLASLQIEDDYKNLIIYLEELEVLKEDSKKSNIIKEHCIKILESIVKQKEILLIDPAAEIKLLFELQYEI
jgi:hypothetical protein